MIKDSLGHSLSFLYSVYDIDLVETDNDPGRKGRPLEDAIRMGKKDRHRLIGYRASHSKPCQAGNPLRSKDMLLPQIETQAVDPQKGDNESGLKRDDRFSFPWSFDRASCSPIGLDDEIIHLA